MKFSPSALAVVVLASATSTAYAQDAIVQGSGYQVSENTVLHPSVSAQTGVISNVFYEQDNTTTAPVVNLQAKLALEPMDDLSNKGGSPRDIDFSAGLRLDYQEFLSSNPNVRAQRNLGIGADLVLDIKPRGQFPVTVEDHFVRANRPTNFESDIVLARNINQLKLQAGYQPEGRNIAGRVSYTNVIDAFDATDATFSNRLLNTFQLGVDWQFLPITRFFAEASYGINTGLGADSTKVSSNPIRGMLGVATALTEVITLRAKGGYAYAPYDAGASFSGFIGETELGYRYSPVGRVRAMYRRAFQDSINANFYTEHMGKVALDQQIGRVMFQGDVAARLRQYQGVPAIIGGLDVRDDTILSTTAKADYALREWLAINATFDFASVQTDFRATIDGEIDDPSYVRFQLMAGASAAF